MKDDIKLRIDEFFSEEDPFPLTNDKIYKLTDLIQDSIFSVERKNLVQTHDVAQIMAYISFKISEQV
jgi:hypothetical protein